MACWQLKGQGAANLVFSYCGGDESLAGHVLRVRKTAAHATSTIDQTIWSGVLRMNGDDAGQHDLSYIAQVMAPLLGRQYVFPGEYIPVPEDLRSALEGVGGRDDVPAHILPDHTTFLSCTVPGYTPVGPAVCLEIKPKWGLRPGGRGIAEAAAAAASADHPRSEATEDTTGQGALPQASALASEGQGTGTTAEEGTDPRLRYPRFMLHMLLKHVKDGVPFSLYNPMDLFSGEPARMQAALWRLLESPSNNLRVFKDGARVYGAGTAAPGAAAAAAGSNGGPVAHAGTTHDATDAANGACDQVDDHRVVKTSDPESGASRATDGDPAEPHLKPPPRAVSSLDALASALEGFLPSSAGSGLEKAPLKTTGAKRTATEMEGRAGSPCEATVDGENGTVGTEANTEAKAETGHLGAGSASVLDTLVRLAVLALVEEGIMARLYGAQDLDDVGPEGALRIFRKLQEEEEEQGVPKAAAGAAAVAAAGQADEAGGATPQLEALRRYLTSVTAKDCGIMVTVQRALPTGGVAASAGAGGDGKDGCGAPIGAATAAAATAAAATAGTTRPWARLLLDPATGQSYLYKVAFVDLDLKPASKIPHHVALDGKLAACARQHAALLRELAARAGWSGGDERR